jgi:hypothetical protein
VAKAEALQNDLEGEVKRLTNFTPEYPAAGRGRMTEFFARIISSRKPICASINRTPRRGFYLVRVLL